MEGNREHEAGWRVGQLMGRLLRLSAADLDQVEALVARLLRDAPRARLMLVPQHDQQGFHGSAFRDAEVVPERDQGGRRGLGLGGPEGHNDVDAKGCAKGV